LNRRGAEPWSSAAKLVRKAPASDGRRRAVC
jgi:hypothetical protein